MMKLKWEGSVYEVRGLNAKEYMGIERIIRAAKKLDANAPLDMDGGDFTAGLIVACVLKDDCSLTWAEVGELPAKLYQALSNAASKLNTLAPKEEEALFFESSTEKAV